MSESAAQDGGNRSVSNGVTGDVHGTAVQSSHIENLTIHAAAPRRVPRQIRPSFSNFVNRTAELAALTEALEAVRGGAGPVVAVLTGLGGVGKTELVAQWARLQRAAFPHGELYVDLGAHRRDGGVDLGAVLGSFLRALGVEKEHVPDSVAERTGLYLTVTAGLRLLVFLDNVEHAAEVRGLLPSDGLVVVATRKELSTLAIGGAVVHRVAPLSTEAGSELIHSWVGGTRGSDEDVTALVRFCSGLPLALNAVGGQLLSRRSMTIRQVVAELADRRENAVDETFDAVYASLSAPARELYRLVGIHPGHTFTLELALAAGCEQAAEAIDELRNAHLVDPSGEGGDRFGAHDVVRGHARRRARAELTEEQRQAVLRPVVEYYRTAAALADRHILGDRLRLQEPPAAPADPGLVHDLDWLEQESGNFAAVLRAAAAHGWHGSVWRLCESLWPLYHGRKLYDDWAEGSRLGIEAAHWDGRPDAAVRMHNTLARAQYELGEYREAAEQLDRARALLSPGSDPRLAGMVLETRGLLLLRQDRAADAVALFTEARRANQGDPHGVVVQSYNLAQALLAAGRPQEALETVAETARLAEQGGEAVMAMRLGILRGRVHDSLGDLDQARRDLADAARQAAELRQRVKELQALELLAELATRAGDPAAAQAAHERALLLRRAAGMRPD
ncbi:NB-ARC domain-containing protein [Kitasatospora sp. NPDC006697]|uniref:NB-ARC domain-containing protein n=1 Tax=Kitasatospora sp. NPDC006697 TaxID=3364020 RepID=UPI0036813A8E